MPGETGNFREFDPFGGKNNWVSNLFNNGNPYTFLQLATDIGGPPLYEWLRGPARRDARERAKVDLTTPELRAGVVRDLVRPNLGLPSRIPSGSSMMENIFANEFRNAFGQTQKNAWELQNEQSKMAQEQQIVDRQNQNAMVEANVANQEELANAQLAQREVLMDKEDSMTSWESLFANTSKDLGQLAYLKEAQDYASAQHILTNPEAYGVTLTDGKPVGDNARLYNWAMQRMMGARNISRNGRKLRTKFSY